MCGECDYRSLADHVIDKLNPRDGEESELYLCEEAITIIADYVNSLPCTCAPGAFEHYVDPCGRCYALGRAENKEVER